MIAVPINTTLIVIIMGVTLFLEIVDIRKHKHDTDIITRVDKIKARKNRQIISSSASSNNHYGILLNRQHLAIMSSLIKCRKRTS